MFDVLRNYNAIQFKRISFAIKSNGRFTAFIRMMMHLCVNSISKNFQPFFFGFHLFSNLMLFSVKKCSPLEFYENPITLQMPVKQSHIKRNQIPDSSNKRSNTVATLLFLAMLNSKIHIFSLNSKYFFMRPSILSNS